MTTTETSDNSTDNTPTAVLEISSGADEFHYQDICIELTHALNQINPDNNTYTSHGTNVGWNNNAGTTEVTLENGEDLIHQITPRSGSWNMTIEQTDDRLSITLSHHDSPTGETHEIHKA